MTSFFYDFTLSMHILKLPSYSKNFGQFAVNVIMQIFLFFPGANFTALPSSMNCFFEIPKPGKYSYALIL